MFYFTFKIRIGRQGMYTEYEWSLYYHLSILWPKNKKALTASYIVYDAT
jgi:hypothetical protein